MNFEHKKLSEMAILSPPFPAGARISAFDPTEADPKNRNKVIDPAELGGSSGGGSLVTLTESTTFYVDINNGTDALDKGISSGSGAWASLQYAQDFLEANVDAAGYNITVSIANGTYAGLLIKGNILRCPYLAYSGDETTPGNVVLESTAHVVNVRDTSMAVNIFGLRAKVTSSSYQSCFYAVNACVVLRNVSFEGNSLSVGLDGYNSYVVMKGGACDIRSDFFYFFNIRNRIHLTLGSGFLVTAVGSPAFTIFLNCRQNSYFDGYWFAKSGVATGKRYAISEGSFAVNMTSSASLFGSTAGSVDSSSHYQT